MMKKMRKALCAVAIIALFNSLFTFPSLAVTPDEFVFNMEASITDKTLTITLSVTGPATTDVSKLSVMMVVMKSGDVALGQPSGTTTGAGTGEPLGTVGYVPATGAVQLFYGGGGTSGTTETWNGTTPVNFSWSYDISTMSIKAGDTVEMYVISQAPTLGQWDGVPVSAVQNAELASCTVTSSSAQATITADTSAVTEALKPGDTFTVPVVIANNPGIFALQNTLTYDTSALECNGVTAGTIDGFNAPIFGTNVLLEAAAMADITSDGTLYNLSFTVKENAAAGTYPISLDGDVANAANNPVNFTYVPGSVTVAEKVVPAGYSVNVTADSDQVTTGGTVKVNLDITNGDGKTTFNDMQDVVLTYDSTNFTFDQANSTLQGFEATDSNGTLTIHGYGPTVNLDDSAAEIVLAFTAGSVEKDNCEFTLNSAKIDAASNADQNISEVSAINGKPTVSIVKPYVVTFHANGHGTDPAAQNVKIGGKATKPENLTETGWNFEGWYTEEACENEYDFSQEVTGDLELFAKWTEVQEETSIDEIITSEYNTIGDYTLVKVTVKNPGTHVPNYDGETMYKVPNIEGADFYDQDAYYCVVKDYNAEKVGLTEGTSVKEIDKTTYKGDANMTHFVDINDAQFAYNLYNTGTISVTYTPTAEQLLSSDVNGDGTVDVNDCNAVITAMS